MRTVVIAEKPVVPQH